MNCRVNPLEDSFTSVSHRGKAVVDYSITTHEGIHNIEHFKVINITDLITERNLQHLCTAKLSDHSMLSYAVVRDRHMDEFHTERVHRQEHTGADDFSTGRDGPFDKPPQRYRKGNLERELMS